ncbi:uncharacterized protein E0L32_004902 [Thyridium curvatum]|uniref:Uncharacterized protein n=1 Tax=Thyridium curvatum TaxID=1093900 RepID=A0A507AYK8_9PEZI|nr:uncharacterized protein E0L32_004902 [Thyridium curvatum]TPX15072.1 hypothetical protein E0L32_004902 [Thyridium curvatum]
MGATAQNSTTILPYGSHYDILSPCKAERSSRAAVYNFDGIQRYARTYVCPECHVAGFGPSVITRHVKRCKGSRRQTFNSCRRKRPVHCSAGCGNFFLRNALKTHTCGIVADPLWLGEQAGPPDLSIIAVRWYRNHGLTLGGVPGEMPDAVPDEAISLPLLAGAELPQLFVAGVPGDYGEGYDEEDEESKDTPSGVHLCRGRGCRQPVSALWHCRFHAEQITRINHRAEFRKGPSPAVVNDFLTRTPSRRLPATAWRAVKQAMGGDALKGEPGASVLFVDTESVYDYQNRRFTVCEVAIVSARGDLMLCTPIGLSVAETRQELARIGVSPSAVIAEWSLGGFDLQAMKSTFGNEHSPRQSLLGPRPWRELGLVSSVALRPLYSSVFPDSHLNARHHRADVDTKKLFRMTQIIMDLFVLE